MGFASEVGEPVMAHLTPDQVGLFLAGDSTGRTAGEVESHIDACDTCRQLISETVRLRHANQAALAPTMVRDEDAKLPVVVGDVVDHRYRIERLLGIGGMGCVFEAHHTHLNQRMALKFMLPELGRDPNAVDRFTREARAAVRLVTEHVGRVLDLGQLPSGTPYLVMEFLQGETVEQRLTREGPFQKTVAVRLVRDALEALEEAHALGIVHRDLKPANLFLARRSNGLEVVKVLDFGIAKSIDPDIEAGLGNTSRRMLLGSPLYMAPEQLSGGDVDGRVDVWAMGCTLYQLLTGETPFRGGDLVELMYSIQTRPHPSLAQRLPSLKPLSEVIDACLKKDPNQRVGSVVLLRRLLDEAIAASASAEPVPKKRRWPLAVGVAGACGLLGLGALGWRAQSRLPTQPQPVIAPKPVPTPMPVIEPVVATLTVAKPEDAGLPETVEPVPAVVKSQLKVMITRPPMRVEPPPPPVAPKRDVLDERL